MRCKRQRLRLLFVAASKGEPTVDIVIHEFFGSSFPAAHHSND